MKIHVHIFFLKSKPKGGKKAEKEKQFTRSSFTKVSVNSQLIRHNRSWLNSKIIEWSLTWYICTFVSRSHFLCWKALEPKAVSSINSLKGRLQRGGSPVVQDQREQSESETEMQEVPSEHQETVCQLWKWPNNGRNYPERWWSIHPCKYAKVAWTWSWRTGSRTSSPSMGFGLGDLQRTRQISALL